MFSTRSCGQEKGEGMNTILKDCREAFENDNRGLLKSEQLVLLEYAELLEKRLEKLKTLTQQQSMELNLLRVKCGEYKLVKKEK